MLVFQIFRSRVELGRSSQIHDRQLLGVESSTNALVLPTGQTLDGEYFSAMIR